MIFKDKFIIGAHFAGIPIYLSGRSNDLAWGSTILYSDCSDIFEEKIRNIGENFEYFYKD